MGYKIKIDKYDKEIAISCGKNIIAKMNDKAFVEMSEAIIKFLIGRGYSIKNPFVKTRYSVKYFLLVAENKIKYALFKIKNYVAAISQYRKK